MTYAPFWPVKHQDTRHPAPCGVILRTISEKTRLPQHVILSGDRRKPAVEARHLAMWAVRLLSSHSLLWIGRRFKRDHSTVIHAINKVQRLRAEDEAYRRDTDSLLASCRQALEEGT